MVEETPPRKKILIGLTGSVASVKCSELMYSFLELNYDVRVIATKSALHFVALSEGYDLESKKRLDEAISFRRKSSGTSSTESISSDEKIFLTDEDEWKSYKHVGGGKRGSGDPVLHIELRKWADVFVIAPLSANTLAKIANGLCDNLLTSVARAWEFTTIGGKIQPQKPIIVAPAMNTAMWHHPLTSSHLKVIESLGFIVVQPVKKVLACGDIGDGALASIQDIIRSVQELINNDGKELSSSLKTEEEIQEGFTRC